MFDARVYLSQAVLDLDALNDTRSEAHNVDGRAIHVSGARAISSCWSPATLYLQALAAAARAESARAQRQTAQALYHQAVDLKQSGLVAGIDVLRAEVRAERQISQRATAAANDFEKAKLQLARVIGLPLGQAFALDRERCPSCRSPT